MPRTIQGYYGVSSKTPCNIFVEENLDGSSWYVTEGGQNVNCTSEPLGDGVWIETVEDFDYFRADNPVTSEEELQAEVEDFR